MTNNNFITPVCGFPRCGSSLTMAMLQAGGLPLYYDPDKTVSFETDRNSELPENSAWLSDCYSKAVKILEPLHFRPPKGHRYKIIWLDRDLKEQVKSNVKFARLVAGLRVPREYQHQLMEAFKRDRQPTIKLLNDLSDGNLWILSFERMLRMPDKVAHELRDFLGLDLDTKAMASVVIKRDPRCLPGMLEARLIERYELTSPNSYNPPPL